MEKIKGLALHSNPDLELQLALKLFHRNINSCSHLLYIPNRIPTGKVETVILLVFNVFNSSSQNSSRKIIWLQLIIHESKANELLFYAGCA